MGSLFKSSAFQFATASSISTPKAKMKWPELFRTRRCLAAKNEIVQ